jgi:GR25 family glycosyltransferase involved in LPS biosynthesis
MHIYCINLEHREDRRITVGAEFEREGLDVEFFPAVDGRVNTPTGLYVTPPEYGCSMSHTNIWRDIVEKKHTISLIFEDDVCLVPDFITKLQIVLEEAKGLPWDVIHLGPLLPIKKGLVSTILYEGQPLGTHAYLISYECAKKIAPFDARLMKVSVDFQLNRFPIRIFCVNEPLAKQMAVDENSHIGLLISAFDGDIGFSRTFDFHYLIRYMFHKFRPLIILVVSILLLYIVRRRAS